MSIHAEKIRLIEWLASINDQSILEKIKEIRDQAFQSSDWWDQLGDAEKNAIEEGLKDIEEGRETPYSEVKKDIKKWLSK